MYGSLLASSQGQQQGGGGTLAGNKRPRQRDNDEGEGLGPISAARAANQRKLEVRDEEGRKRFHGAFTGGFSAGYFNTVGSKEGWQGPASFVSSRSNRHDFKVGGGGSTSAGAARRGIDAARQFMDEEDEREILGGGGVNEVFAGLGQRGMLDAKKKASSASSSSSSSSSLSLTAVTDRENIPDELLAPSSTPIGKEILQNLGWRPGQPLGPLHLRGLASERQQKDFGLDSSLETLQNLWDAAAERFPELDALGNTAGASSSSSSYGSAYSSSSAKMHAGLGYKPPSDLRSIIDAQRRLEEVGGFSSAALSSLSGKDNGGEVGSKRQAAMRALGMGRDHYSYDEEGDDDDGEGGGSVRTRGRLMMSSVASSIGGVGGVGALGIPSRKAAPLLSIRDAFDDDIDEGGEDQVGLRLGSIESSTKNLQSGGGGKVLSSLQLQDRDRGTGATMMMIADADANSVDDAATKPAAMLTDNLPVFVRSARPIDAEIAALAKKHPYSFPLQSFPPNYRVPLHIFAQDEELLFASAMARERERLKEREEKQYTRELAAHFPGLAGAASSSSSSSAVVTAGDRPHQQGASTNPALANAGSAHRHRQPPSVLPPPGLGRSSRAVVSWAPAKLLLKRCNIADPLTKEQRRAAEAGEEMPVANVVGSSRFIPPHEARGDPSSAAAAAFGLPQTAPAVAVAVAGAGRAFAFKEFVESSTGALTASQPAATGGAYGLSSSHSSALSSTAALPAQLPAFAPGVAGVPELPAAPPQPTRKSRWDNHGPVGSTSTAKDHSVPAASAPSEGGIDGLRREAVALLQRVLGSDATDENRQPAAPGLTTTGLADHFVEGGLYLG